MCLVELCTCCYALYGCITHSMVSMVALGASRGMDQMQLQIQPQVVQVVMKLLCASNQIHLGDCCPWWTQGWSFDDLRCSKVYPTQYSRHLRKEAVSTHASLCGRRSSLFPVCQIRQCHLWQDRHPAVQAVQTNRRHHTGLHWQRAAGPDVAELHHPCDSG